MTQDKSAPYKVLARKYRPQNFSELIGQEALVRTLTNAINTGRIAHAFMLTGVRGVGKTTTARIIAKALNYKGPEGTAGPTTGPTDDCPLCQAISEDRHPDVLEMDAASRTGVDDIREILDGVRYAPTEARYKVYIIDEVHMLSRQAFNALLKTLEEPPEHVIFIFATTEIRKVPVTVLSRCQRFDLRRVDVPTLTAHYKKIAESENTDIEEEALALIARAADGSVRDGLSLLDQAIAHSESSVTAAQVQAMLGLADRARNLDLLEHALQGNMPEALGIMDDLYKSGSDPLVLIQDLLALCHVLTRLRAVPGAGEMNYTMAADEVARAQEIAKAVSMPSLGKSWQILLKGISEVQTAPDPQGAAEMVIIRLAYAADLPDPADLLKKLKDGDTGGRSHGQGKASAAGQSATVTAQVLERPASGNLAVSPQLDPGQVSALHSLEDVVALLEQGQELLLAGEVYQYVHLVKLTPGRLEINIEEAASPRLAQDLGQALSRLTEARWMVTVSGAQGSPSLVQQERAAKDREFSEVLQMPVIREVMKVFPDAQLTAINSAETYKEG